MKLEDYFKIMDCASDEDITRMMQTRRPRLISSGEEHTMKQSDFYEMEELHMTSGFRQDPTGEENTMKQSDTQEKKEIRMTRRGLASGTAVAAVLLALNVGFGSFLLHDPVRTADKDSDAAETIQTTAATTVAADVTEITAAAISTRIMGFLNCARKRASSVGFGGSSSLFAPNFSSRLAASSAVRPPAVLPTSSRTFSADTRYCFILPSI